MLYDPRFWVAVSFIGFVVLLFKPLRRAVLGGLDSRTARIERELSEATRLKEEAGALLATYQRQHTESVAEAKRIVEDAEREAIAIAKQAQKDLEDAINRRIELALQKMANSEAAILQDIRNHAIEITTETVRRMVAEHLSPEMARELVTSSMGEVSRKLN